MPKLEIHEWTADQVTEYECTDDGQYLVTARSVQRARQAFLDGDLGPLLALRHMLGCPDRCAPSPHLSQLLIKIIEKFIDRTDRIKRPKHRPKKFQQSQPLTITEITSIGISVRNHKANGDGLPCNDRNCCPDPDQLKASRWHPMKLEAAIARVAEGVPALKGRNGEEIIEEDYSPPIPLNRVRASYAAFLKLQGEPKPWDGQPCRPWKANPTKPMRHRAKRPKLTTKKKPITTTHSRTTRSTRKR